MEAEPIVKWFYSSSIGNNSHMAHTIQESTYILMMPKGHNILYVVTVKEGA
jgi:hypothetical protein